MRLWQYAGEFCTAQWQAGQRRPAKPSGFRGPLPLIIQIPTLKKQIIKVENETLANAKSQQWRIIYLVFVFKETGQPQIVDASWTVIFREKIRSGRMDPVDPTSLLASKTWSSLGALGAWRVGLSIIWCYMMLYDVIWICQKISDKHILSYPQIGHVHGGKSIQQRLGMVIAGRLRWRQWGSGDGPGVLSHGESISRLQFRVFLDHIYPHFLDFLSYP